MFDDLFAPPAAPDGPPLVTFVCTGNICRSPLAEKVFRARIDSLPNEGIIASSAGLQAVVGARMDTLPEAIAVRYGADPSHEAVQISEQLLRSSTLVITMTREQRAEVAREYPFAMKRTFTLSEFVRILDELASEVPRPSVSSRRTLFQTMLDASRFRGMIALSDEDDIEDPFRRSAETHERVGSRIGELVDRLAWQVSGIEARTNRHGA
ncbi:hypothetical protein N1027_01330 [Herbiconiux sp. CPCC 205763]|uniref:Phosphotyrosine protein phosphatase I domain-containing protein n=1 Tax=Herbiconiux aconitum TaxID=2970913 RepID=A0ABT2GKM8_9MICO|nr:hypothetical protein [Herbiconiux aconitum]MCS5716772.1 hypothetical protein [Herbiconiux aconitum]